MLSALCGAITDLNFNGAGYAWQLVNCVFTAGYSLTLRGIMDKVSTKIYFDVTRNQIFRCMRWSSHTGHILIVHFGSMSESAGLHPISRQCWKTDVSVGYTAAGMAGDTHDSKQKEARRVQYGFVQQRVVIAPADSSCWHQWRVHDPFAGATRPHIACRSRTLLSFQEPKCAYSRHMSSSVSNVHLVVNFLA